MISFQIPLECTAINPMDRKIRKNGGAEGNRLVQLSQRPKKPKNLGNAESSRSLACNRRQVKSHFAAILQV